MDESEESNVDDSKEQTEGNARNKNNKSDKTSLASKNKAEEEEGTISECSISEHVTSASGSLENDRSFQEIEIFNQPSALTDMPSLEHHISQEQKPNSFILNSFSSSVSNGLPKNAENLFSKVTIGNEGTKNAKSILEEILGDTQFCSEVENTNSKDESFNLFANVDFSDKSLINLPSNNDISLNEKNLFASNFELPLDLPEEQLSEKNSSDVDKKLKQLEEIVAVKDSTINALTQELDSFREMSNPTNTLSMVSATEYKQLQEDCHNKLMEYNSAVIYKNDLIQKLSESLDQSVTERKELLSQVEMFKHEIAQLQNQLQETSKMVQEHECNVSVKVSTENVDLNLQVDNIVSNNFSNEKERLAHPTNEDMLKLQNEVIDLKDKIKHDKEDYETEINRLRDLVENIKCGSTELMELKTELEKKHTKEVEELRTYFEKKCVELEKNYSEEVFSQQSRKMSGSSSDIELSADILLSNEPGASGDHNKVIKSKEDVEKLRENLTSFLQKVSEYSLEDLDDKELVNIELEVKTELNVLLKIGEKLEIKAIQNKYLEEISNLKYQLEEETKRHANISICSAVQEVGASGEFEINEVIESYERRLQEQVILAKIDIINALQLQIQRLVSNEADDEEWPSELLLLRDRFTDKYEIEIKNLKEEHDAEITKIKDEHLKILNGALDRARRRSLRDEETVNKGEMELLKERDGLKRQVISLRNLLSELVKYFTQAEDELNNTLVDNLLKSNNENLTLEQLEEELNNESSGTTNSSKVFDSLTNVTRVHFAPNFGELINMIEHQSQEADESVDISVDLKNELGMCLEKLKQDANAILLLTVNTNKVRSLGSSPKGTPDEKFSSISKQFHLETQHKKRLKQELVDANEIIVSMEKEKEILESRTDELLEKINILESDLSQARYKIAELIENGRKEVVSEGYGEEGNHTLHGLGDTMTALSNLQEDARTMLAQSRTSADPNALHLIEELCRVGEKIKEEAMKEKRELLLQIEAADKKYKTTQKFLEEQAVEREQERDEAQKKIEGLFEQLKERDKDREKSQILSNEAENLEQQLNDATNRLREHHAKYKELEEDRDEAVEKLKILRDIIHDLEHQLHDKDHEIQDHLRNVEKLECIVGQQHKSIDEFKLFDSFGDVSDIHGLRKHCEELEQELQRLRIQSELAGSEGALNQIKLQLCEFEASLDKKTKDLELLHSTGTTSCSSPSEDMSVRDMIKQQAPSSAAMDECEVPLQQLARLKEKLLRHSRAEEAAIKRIQDLEMQVTSLKSELEESQNEKEFMKRQIHEQLVLISDFQIRLDQQRIKAEHIEKQTNTSLESKIYDLQEEIVNLQEKLRNKDKTIQHQDHFIKETQQRLKDIEIEIATAKDDDIVVDMQKEVEALRLENQQIKEKLSTENQILPNLVENIIQDKNADIEKLRDKLNQTEKLLYSYEALNLNKNDLRTLSNLKNSGGSIEQLISILDLSQPIDQARRCDNSKEDELSGLNQTSFKKSNNDTELLGSSLEPEISSIEKIGPSNLHYTVSAPLGKPNSTELAQKSAEKRVRFEDTSASERLAKEIESLNKELETKNKLILEMEAKINILNEFEDKITKLQHRLDETELALTNATKAFEKEQEATREKERDLGVQLAEKKMHLSEMEKEIQALKEDSVRKDEMTYKLAKEKRDLEQSLLAFKKDSFENLDMVLKEKTRIQGELTESRLEIQRSQEDADNRNANQEIQMNSLINQLNTMNQERLLLEKNIEQKDIEHDKMIKKLEETLKKKEALVIDKDCDLEIMNEDLKYYQDNLTELENKLKSTEDPVAKRQLQEEKFKVSELTKEIAHLQDLVREKDIVIGQLREDQKQLHSNIKAIDSKIKETGNIFDLSVRLREEQKKNADLLEEIHGVKAKLLNYDVANAVPVEEITGQLKKELECAALIDANILSAVSDQSLSSISEGQDIEVYKKSLTRQKTHTKQLLRVKNQLEKQRLSLEQQCNNLQQRCNEMQNVLDKERITFRQAQIEDVKLIEQLRIKLDGALDMQDELERVLEEEKHCRKALEVQLEELKKTGSTTSSESTKYKTSPSQDALEVAHLRKELDAVKDEKNKLVAEMKSLKQANSELESNIKFTKEMLMLEAERCRVHDEKFRVLNEKERSLADELLRKRFELEVKDRENDEKKIKMDELEQEKNLLKKQKADLLKALKAMPSTAMDAAVPEALENAIRELKQKTDENKRTLDYLEKLENEKKHLEGLLRNEVRNNSGDKMPFPDLVARCNYLFSKALKLDSVRKTLIWQKRYLMDYLQSHQRHCLIEVLPNQPHENHCIRNRHSPLEHFRSAVYAVISIERMKFLVRRWHSGIRKYEKINARHYERSKQIYLQENPGAAANFHVGQPVSNQHFSPSTFRINPTTTNPFQINPTTTNPFVRDQITTDESRPVSPAISVMTTIRDAPWSGNTPPSKENMRRTLRIGSNFMSKEDMTPLKAPQLLNQLHARVEQVQEKLNIPFSSNT